MLIFDGVCGKLLGEQKQEEELKKQQRELERQQRKAKAGAVDYVPAWWFLSLKSLLAMCF